MATGGPGPGLAMGGRKASKTTVQAQRLRDKVIANYGTIRLQAEFDRLCTNCTWCEDKCIKGILPITSTGEQCPYFQRTKP